MSPEVQRAIALDHLAGTAKRRKLVALYYPGRILLTTDAIYPGDYVRVPVNYENIVDFQTDYMAIKIAKQNVYGMPYYEYGKLFMYYNQPEDKKHFEHAIDNWFREINHAY